MARRTQTYAVRLAVEGGGQVKAELVSVGQSGEQSLKRIESGGDRASGGLKGLGRQAELLRTGIRTLGGALAGVATVGGLGALVDRSISAADAIGKTADKIGVGVEALQELHFAAKASGVETQTLDMALQRFTRRAAEAAQGTGEAKDALAQMGITLRDQSGNLRRSEDLLADVADAFARIEDPAERVRLAFKLFDSEGVPLVNLLSDGSGALEEMRERAQALGIVLDEHLVRDAERARTELDTLSQVISANLTRAALEAAPVVADLSGWLADVAGKASIAWERLRYADASIFDHAPRYHGGGFAGGGLLPDEVPIIARRGELVVPPERVVREERTERDRAPITVVINVTAADANSFRASQGQIAAEMARAIDRAGRNR